MVTRQLLLLMVLCLIALCQSKRNFKRRRLQEVLQPNETSESNSTILNWRNRTRHYSMWSPWSRCSKRCKQVRTRHCLMPSECGTSLFREERTCFKGRCKNQQVKNVGMISDMLAQQDKTLPPDFTILYNLLQPSPYGDWTAWSPCSRNCLTHRSKTCRVSEICGEKTLRESALCYIEDTACERLYSRKRKQKKSSNDIGQNGTRIHPLDGLKCGVAPKSLELRGLLRIIGGREAARGSWPWQVTILNKYREPFCGGTLLNEGWVLTAAHCFRRRLIVRAGEHNLMTSEGIEQESKVAEIIAHPEYDDQTVNNDVALLRLKNPFSFNQYVQPICLPLATDELEINSRAVIIGWGKRKNTALYGTDELHQAEVPVVDINACRENYSGYHITNKMLCAGFKQGRVDSCAGDSGGPLLYQKEGKWTIFGITSFGEGCGQKGKFGIYANVPKYVKWIRKTISRNS